MWSSTGAEWTYQGLHSFCPSHGSSQLPVASQLGAELCAPLPSPCGPCSGLLAQALYDWRLIACSCPAASRISCSLVVIHHLWLFRLPALLPSEIPEPCGGQCGTCVPPQLLKGGLSFHFSSRRVVSDTDFPFQCSLIARPDHGSQGGDVFSPDKANS